ncbi:MAG: lipopolysaccharide biosynthesis protein [Bacteroidales bacterium]
MSLKQQTANALGWNLIDRIGTQVVYLITGIVLARLLSVSDFGLIGMLSIFVGLSTILVDGGFSSALIRKQGASEVDYNTVFYLNMGISLLLYSILYMSAPFIAEFYSQPQLVSLSRVLFLGIIINSAALIQSTLYTKQINFKVQVVTNALSLVIAGSSAIILAYKGAGPWALVSQTLILSICKTTALWIVSSWRPRLIFSIDSLKSILGYSSNLLGSQIVNSLFNNLYTLTIGRLFSVVEVGYYSQAQKMNDMATSVINNPIQAATFPIFSTIQDDPDRLLRAFRKTMRFAMFVTFLTLPMLLLVSRPFMLFLLGDKWIGSVPYLQLILVGSIFNLITALVNSFLRIPGRTDVLLRLEFAKVFISVVFLVLTIPYGALAVILGLVISRIIICIVNMYVSSRYIDYSFPMQTKDILPYVALSAISCVISWPISLILEGDLYLLVTQCSAYSIIFFSLAWLFNSKVLVDVISTLKRS